jgi:hypothetical protein
VIVIVIVILPLTNVNLLLSSSLPLFLSSSLPLFLSSSLPLYLSLAIYTHSSDIWKSNKYLPLASDEDKLNLLVINLDNSDKSGSGSEGSIHEWDIDDGLGDEISPSLEMFLEKYRDNLMKGQYEWLDSDCGVTEKMSSGSGSGSGSGVSASRK